MPGMSHASTTTTDELPSQGVHAGPDGGRWSPASRLFAHDGDSLVGNPGWLSPDHHDLPRPGHGVERPLQQSASVDAQRRLVDATEALARAAGEDDRVEVHSPHSALSEDPACT